MITRESPGMIHVPGLSRAYLLADTSKPPYRGIASSLLAVHSVTEVGFEAIVAGLGFFGGRLSDWVLDRWHDHGWWGRRQRRDMRDVVFIGWFQRLVKDVIVSFLNGRRSTLVGEDNHEDSHGDENGEYQYRMHGTTIATIQLLCQFC